MAVFDGKHLQRSSLLTATGLNFLVKLLKPLH